MDNLPPELLLKIAGYCDFAEVCAISKVNRHWNGVIESNWNSLKKVQVERIAFSERSFEKSIECEIWCNFRREKSLGIKVSEGSEDGNVFKILEDGWTNGWEIYVGFDSDDIPYASPKNVGKFLEDLFAPIFRRSDILHLHVYGLKPSTLQMLISLLERFRPTVGSLNFEIGSKDHHKRMEELMGFARIVELSKPDELEFHFADCFTKEDVCEGFLKKIANLYIPCVTMSWPYKDMDFEPGPTLHVPLPNCSNLVCEECTISNISALYIVDLVEEWSNNERDIVRYELMYFSEDMSVFAAKFEKVLKERDLPVRFEVVKENTEFLVDKIAKRGDKQDQLRLKFGVFLDDCCPGRCDCGNNILITNNDEQRGPLP